MKKFTFVLIIFISLTLLGIGAVFLLPLPTFERDIPRPNFWDYPKLSEAKYTVSYTDDGKLSLELEHPIIKGVTPKMVAWWYRHLASGKYTVQGVNYDFYHLFHLSEHGRTTVVSPADDGSMKMAKGAIVYRQECFGPHFSKGKGKVLEFGDNGYVVTPVMGPLTLGRIEHTFLEKDGGTLYKVKTILGSDIPVIGRIINLFITKRQFAPEVVQEWLRHQVEEVGSMTHYLPKIYAEQSPTMP